jgi:hydrogenase expression/formation protein HypC
MCLALPARVIERGADDQLLIDLGGIRKSVSGALTPEAMPGDYVIVHVGHAIGTLDAQEAERTLALFAELAASQAAEDAAMAGAAASPAPEVQP